MRPVFSRPGALVKAPESARKTPSRLARTKTTLPPPELLCDIALESMVSTQIPDRLAADHASLHADGLPPNYIFPSEVSIASFAQGSGDTAADNPIDVDSQGRLLLEFLLTGPDSTPYSAGLFRLRLEASRKYPQEPPLAWFRTRIWHPNVEEQSGRVRLQELQPASLGGFWDESTTIRDILLLVCSMLVSPVAASAGPAQAAGDEYANMDAARLYFTDPAAYVKKSSMMCSVHAPVPRGWVDTVRLAKHKVARDGEDVLHPSFLSPMSASKQAGLGTAGVLSSAAGPAPGRSRAGSLRRGPSRPGSSHFETPQPGSHLPPDAHAGSAGLPQFPYRQSTRGSGSIFTPVQRSSAQVPVEPVSTPEFQTSSAIHARFRAAQQRVSGGGPSFTTPLVPGLHSSIRSSVTPDPFERTPVPGERFRPRNVIIPSTIVPAGLATPQSPMPPNPALISRPPIGAAPHFARSTVDYGVPAGSIAAMLSAVGASYTTPNDHSGRPAEGVPLPPRHHHRRGRLESIADSVGDVTMSPISANSASFMSPQHRLRRARHGQDEIIKQGSRIQPMDGFGMDEPSFTAAVDQYSDDDFSPLPSPSEPETADWYEEWITKLDTHLHLLDRVHGPEGKADIQDRLEDANYNLKNYNRGRKALRVGIMRC